MLVSSLEAFSSNFYFILVTWSISSKKHDGLWDCFGDFIANPISSAAIDLFKVSTRHWYPVTYALEYNVNVMDWHVLRIRFPKIIH